jgi:hypothetical protein
MLSGPAGLRLVWVDVGPWDSGHPSKQRFFRPGLHIAPLPARRTAFILYGMLQSSPALLVPLLEVFESSHEVRGRHRGGKPLKTLRNRAFAWRQDENIGSQPYRHFEGSLWIYGPATRLDGECFGNLDRSARGWDENLVGAAQANLSDRRCKTKEHNGV